MSKLLTVLKVDYENCPPGYNMLSGKTMYYNSIKTETKAESQVTLANGSTAPSTQLGEHFCQYQHQYISRTVNIRRFPCHADNSILSFVLL